MRKLVIGLALLATAGWASDIRSDEVRGAHFLTTVGTVPRVDALGVINQTKLTCTAGNPGTCTLYDDTAMTGITYFWVRAGDNQGVTPLVYFSSSAGAALGGINASNTLHALGGWTATEVAIKRSGVDLQVRLADDSLYSYMDALGVKVGGAGTLTRYLRGNATAFVISSGAASGTGACGAGNFVNVLNDDAAPGCAVPAGAGGYATIQDEAAPLVQRAIVNFIGAGVTCVDNPGTVTSDCTIPGFLPGGGIVSINALIPAAQFIAVGNAGADFNVASAVATHTLNLPDAGPAARGAVTTAAQTFAGKKTFTPVANFAGLNVGALAGDAAVPANGDILYNSTSNKFRCYENGAWANCVGAGGAGNVTYTGTYAALPAPGAVAAGDLYMPSNSYYLLRSTGAAWTRWAFGYQAVEPVDGDYAWVNQDAAASTVVTNGGVTLIANAVAGVEQRIRKKAVPAAPYTVTIGFLLNSWPNTLTNGGLLLRDSATGKFVLLFVKWSSGLGLTLSKYTNEHTWSADYVATQAGGMDHHGPLVFLRFVDDNVNRISQFSADGFNFATFHTVGRTDYITPDEIGFSVNAGQATSAVSMSLLHWKQE